MTCIILAAGLSKRMLSLTQNRSKCMIPIANTPILEYIIRNLAIMGMREIVIVVNHGADGIEEYFKCGQDFGVNITYVHQIDKKGTGGALYSAKDHIRGDDVFMVINGDCIVHYNDMIRLFCQKKPAMGVVRSKHPEEYGVIEIDGNFIEGGLLVGINEKPLAPSDNLINAGVYLFDTRIFEYLDRTKESRRGEYELTDAVMMYVKHGGVACVPIYNWINVEHPWDLLDANRIIMSNENETVYGNNVKIHPGCTIEYPCIIGNDCEIGPNAYIRKYTSIGNNCRIGTCVEVKNSIIMDNTNIPHLSYVGDSIIGRNCNLGAATIVANLRHDDDNITVGGVNTGRRKFGVVIGDNTKIGINCSFDPGVVVDSNSRIPPHTYISKKYSGKPCVE
jgi:UDP-N-acetylglucosamine diphosphorylase / glucose-1-phosphate thymidylyltransferase / UDP-N-acetylgalactosamine diphosphorylase / glucosamine-1-phosphate N-acetyltransferase / galactosamine-1-phosphate N-acetyltransferase